jgi:hypothetical protein
MGDKPLPGAKVWQKYSDFSGDESFKTTCKPAKKNYIIPSISNNN